jgi:SAM-dependent methyltransferase
MPDSFDPAHFELLARVEEESFWFRARNRLITWALARDFPEARSLLEVGCGTGYVLRGIAEAAPQLALTGTELHPEGLEIARGRVDADFRQMDARRIPYEQEFDVVGAFDVIEHIDDDERVLAQMRRAVRPGGGIVLTVPQHRWLWSEFDQLSHHQRRYIRSELVGKVQRASFDVLRVTSFVTLLLPAMALTRMRPRRGSVDLEAELARPRPLDAVLDRVMGLELALIRRGVSLPAGGSLLLTARRG